MLKLSMYSTEERKNRVIARGEHSGHSHIIVGGEFKDDILTVRNDNEAVIRHLIEDAWLRTGETVWTEEHKDIYLKKGNYKFTMQQEFSPNLGRAVRVRD